VISDLDISKLTSVAQLEVPTLEPVQVATPQVPSTAGGNGSKGEILSPAEAAAYMQEVVLKLRNWQRSLDKNATAQARKTLTPVHTDTDCS